MVCGSQLHAVVGRTRFPQCPCRLDGLAVPSPYSTTNTVAVLEVFDPAAARLELVLGDAEASGNGAGLGTNELVGQLNPSLCVIGKARVIRRVAGLVLEARQPKDELFLNFGKLARTMLGDTHLFITRDV